MRQGDYFQSPFWFLKKLIWSKIKRSAAYFQYISIVLNLSYKEILRNAEKWSREMLNFDFLEKGLGIVSPPHFEYDFSTKMFLMLYSINWSNLIARLSLLIKILGNMCIAIV